MQHYDLFREKVLIQTQELARRGYLFGTGGNVSMRIEGEEALAITPSGREYLALTVDDICVYSFEREPLAGDLPPSIEMGMHTAVYQNRLDVNAVIHTHQPFASIFTLIDQPIPALFDEQVTQLGNEIARAPYALSGSPQLVQNLAAQLENQCNAYILRNHGVLCTGITMEQTAVNIQVLEKCARVYYYALTTGREISLLDPEIEKTCFSLLKSEQRKEVRRKKKLARAAQKTV